MAELLELLSVLPIVEVRLLVLVTPPPDALLNAMPAPLPPPPPRAGAKPAAPPPRPDPPSGPKPLAPTARPAAIVATEVSVSPTFLATSIAAPYTNFPSVPLTAIKMLIVPVISSSCKIVATVPDDRLIAATHNLKETPIVKTLIGSKRRNTKNALDHKPLSQLRGLTDPRMIMTGARATVMMITTSRAKKAIVTDAM